MKRVLFITYYFPPSGGSGVQRPLKFVKYLPAYGWRPTVLTVDPKDAAYPSLDAGLEAEVPPEAVVRRTPAWDPYAAYARLLGKRKRDTVGVGFNKLAAGGWKDALARWVRGNVFLPDARVGWVPFGIREGRRLLAREPFDMICTSGPPHSMHLIARSLKRTTGTPWVADLADPWTDISYYHALPRTAPARRLEAWLERTTLAAADAVVSVTEGFGALLRRRAPLRRYATIYNGFDEADLDPAPPPPPDPERFVVAHVGMLSAVQHSPGLVEALGARVRRDPAWARRLVARFVGHTDAAILEAFRQAGLGPNLDVVGYVPHAEALDYMRRADLVLAAVQQTPANEGIVPAKVFEYLRVGAPVLGLAPPEGDLARILRETGGGAAFAHADADAIGAYLDEAFARSLRGARAAPADPARLAPYDRRFQAGQLAALFDAVLSGDGRRAVVS